MASPHTSKKTVDMAAPMVRVSRIRRDPPPPVKVLRAYEIKERDARNAVIGVVTVALALFVILIGFNNAAGWSPSQYTIHIDE
jgi:hypothetical protein